NLEIRNQYRNLRDGLIGLPEAIDLPVQAFQDLGRNCEKAIIRGGTDGSQLTEKGLPTPNLSSGQYQIHSVREFACLDQMIEAIEHLQVLLSLWTNPTTDQ
ncbi:MAG: peptidase T, partial [Planctomycetota bacterium]|nr:peptidase T [Planctomycetota bacterium]